MDYGYWDTCLTHFRQEKYLHGLVNNAGIMATPFAKTVDGYESQFQVSFVGLEIPGIFHVYH
jgi:NAD(P)-dependent dehydrogenase (short-subunit alcohol dehydrogenase family)